MKNPPSSSEQALEDYFNDLLGEPVARNSVDAVLAAPQFEEPQQRPVMRLAHLPARIAAAQLAAVPGFATPATLLRAYAEPVRTLNLRMPLPKLAPEPAVAPLLAPITKPAPLEPSTAAVQQTPIAKNPVVPLVEPSPLAPREEPPLPRIEAQPATPVLPEIIPAAMSVEMPTDIAAETAGPAPWLDNGRPAWAQQPFECLLFSVGGLALAAPLAELGSIYMLDPDAVTAIFGQAAWFMGLLPVKGGFNVRTIDGAQVVMPERYTADMRERYRYVISLHGSDWALAVDGVADSVILQPDDVRWRGQRSKRPWLAGTVVTRMCALLDVAQLVWMFENQDGKRSAPRH